VTAEVKPPFVVTLLDSAGSTIYVDELDTLEQSVSLAREYISDQEALDAHRVEVRDADDVCVFDVFAEKVSS
jgi:hypothetical protein